MSDSNDMNQDPFGLEEEVPSSQVKTLSDNETLLAGLSWVSQLIAPIVLPLILLVSDEAKRSAFVKHHAITSIGLAVAALLYEAAAGLVWVIITAVTGGLCCMLWVIFLLPIVPLVYYGIQAFQGKYAQVPYLTPFMKKQGWL